ncbi:Hypothetical predicted protein [Mytilus galloprovincialis]|uniref:Tudor domain-containing protein n=1 Tax=Mytilus galloprovincialis TaxID=29158 RepID=A0A8B6FP76_MYTGA|nr:Hypothetical predicted protein [Mytilus galloprovincialis]
MSDEGRSMDSQNSRDSLDRLCVPVRYANPGILYSSQDSLLSTDRDPPQTERGASTTLDAINIKMYKGSYIPRDPIVEHVTAKVFKIMDHVQIEDEKEKSYRRLEHKEEIIKVGTKILAYFRDDKKWYPAKVIGKKPFGYLVRYEDDKYMHILPPKYLKIC